MNENKEPCVEGLTCFGEHSKHGVACNRKTCRHWIPFEKGKNCTLIAAQGGPMTLQEIGKIYDLTRMRICQIEKSIYKKISETIVQPS